MGRLSAVVLMLASSKKGFAAINMLIKGQKFAGEDEGDYASLINAAVTLLLSSCTHIRTFQRALGFRPLVLMQKSRSFLQ